MSDPAYRYYDSNRMKPKNPSGAKGGQGKRVSHAPPARQRRRGLPLPSVLSRLVGIVLGPAPKPAPRPQPPPATQPPPSAQPEAAAPVEEEVKAAMLEKNELPLEGSKEPVQPQESAGYEEKKEEPASEATRKAAEILARALAEAESVLVGSAPERPAEPTPPEEEKLPGPTLLQETQSLIRTLTEHFDRALDRMADERRILIDEVQSASHASREHLERAIDRIDQDRRSLADQITSLARSLERLERRLDEMSRLVAESRVAAPVVAPAEVEAVVVAPVDTEPAFTPGEEGLTLVISAVPGFQGLMEVQRALMRVPAIEGASVERYFDGEARIVLMLREPITATRLLETLREATGQQLQLEESRPEASRLRVRFQGPSA